MDICDSIQIIETTENNAVEVDLTDSFSKSDKNK